jgi:CRP-like cAMP-binding protein
MRSLEAILAEHPFVKGLHPELITVLMELASARAFHPGEFLFRQGEEADFFYLIDKGKVQVEAFFTSGGPVVLQTLTDGQILGWSWLVPPCEWRFDARSLEFTTAIVLDAKRLRQSMETDHDLGYELLKRFLGLLASRLDAARFQLMGIYGVHT